MTRRAKIITILGIIVGVGVVGAGAVYATQSYLARDRASTGCSARTAAVHTVRIENGAVSPETTYAHRCDTLTITNTDTAERLLAFGVHSHHASYDNTVEKTVGQGESMTVTLVTAGTFVFHDHFDDGVRGHFIVTE